MHRQDEDLQSDTNTHTGVQSFYEDILDLKHILVPCSGLPFLCFTLQVLPHKETQMPGLPMLAKLLRSESRPEP